MEPINTNSSSQIPRYTPRESGSDAAPEQQAKLTESPKFVSPKGNIDPQSGVYVVQFRNAATGNVDFQYPNKKAVAEYSRSDKLVPAPSSGGAAKPAAVVSGSGASVGSESVSSAGSGTVEVAAASTPQPSGGSSAGIAQLGTTDSE